MAANRFIFTEWKNGTTVLRASLHVAKPKGGPWFLFCHGFTGTRIGPGYLFVRLSRALAEEGISSFRFDFAGCGESEGLFRDMTVDTMCADLLSAVRRLRKSFSPSRLILAGHSLGGMVAGLCCDKVKPEGLALLAPVADPEGLVRRRAAILEAGPNKQGYYENGPHEMSPAFLDGLKNLDPAAAAMERFKGSLLLLQGDNDASISVAESQRYIDAARKKGIETEYHLLRCADHNFSTVSHHAAVCSTVTSWAKERFR
jgi:uncharacterized protein